jgi:hypothetical protein
LQNSFSGKCSNYYYQLPPYAQKQADRAFEHFEQDSRYPSLEFKCVNQQKARYSIRINKKGYRALGYIEGDDIIEWYWIDPHDEYMQRIRA